MSISFDRVADDYDQTRGGEQRGRELVSEILPWLAPGPVLEIGVGTGIVAAALTDAGAVVCGVDISARMLRRAYARVGARVVQGDARTLPIGDSAVPNVAFIWVLHLIGDVPAALAEAARVLAPGGRVIAVHAVPERSHTDTGPARDRLEAIRPERYGTAAASDSLDSVGRAASAAGLHALHTGWTRGFTVTLSPNEIADQVEQRVWSYLWDIEESAWQEHAVPAIAELRGLPEPDRPRSVSQRHRLSVFTPAAGLTEA